MHTVLNITRFILYPISIIYGVVAEIIRYFKSKNAYNPTVFTVCVGNLSAGGTGKTPMIIQLANALKQQNFKVAVISRGYGRKETGLHVVNNLSSAAIAGEEPIEIFKKTGIQVIVSANRVLAFKQLKNIDIVLMDDGFQHHKVNPHFNLILDNANFPFFKNKVLPAGTLREFAYHRYKANAFVFTKSKPSFNIPKAKLYWENSKTEVFISSYATIANLPKNIVLVSALAHNKELCANLEIKPIKHFAYKDHYTFTKEDHLKWEQCCILNNASLVCTSKDVSKIKKEWFSSQINVIEVFSEHIFKNNEWSNLIQLILEAHNENTK